MSAAQRKKAATEELAKIEAKSGQTLALIEEQGTIPQVANAEEPSTA